MEPGTSSDSSPPEPPKIDRHLVVALVEHAKAVSVSFQDEIDQAAIRGLTPNPQEYKNVEGWAFVALALAETYDLTEYFD